MRFKVVAALLSSIMMGACSSGAKDSPGADGNDDAAVPGGDASPDGGAGANALPFAPSNVPLSALMGGAPGSMIFDGASCGSSPNVTIDTDDGTTDCARVKPNQNFRYVVAAQADGSNVAVFVTRSLRIEGTMRVRVTGLLPLVIIALDTAQIVGELSAAPTNHVGVAGGFSARVNMGGPGYGPGAGTRSMPGGAGGGSHCGIGGKGAAANAGGPMYGATTLVPLIGGSSGANGSLYEAGAGGGALHIAAGTSIQISTTGIIHAGGAGGPHAGAGGGSGGAILLEAPTITVAGIVAANGGGGGADEGSSYGGADSTPNRTPAAGGGDPTMMHSLGGNGSANEIVNGADGTMNAGGDVGGGGGGAGFIRLNTSAGAASITGTISPAATTPCATQGTLAL